MLLSNPIKKLTPEIEDLFIFGETLDTYYGKIRFYDYREYNQRIQDLSIMSFSMLKFYYMYRENLIKQGATKSDLIALMELKDVDLYDFLRDDHIRRTEHAKLTGMPIESYLESYKRVFNDIIENENIPSFLDDSIYFGSETRAPMEAEDFYNLREIAMRMNLVKEEKMAWSPKVQAYLDKSKKIKNKDSEPPNTTTIMTSIFLHTGTPYAELYKMTAFQIISTYTRIHSLKDFEISSLFATVSPDVTISRWDNNNDLLKEEDTGIDLSQAKQNFDSMMK